MMNRILVSLLLGASMMTVACAAEKPAQADKVETTEKLAQTSTAASSASGKMSFSNVSEDAWRRVDPENLLMIDTAYGLIGVELFPEIAPAHVKQVKALARQGFYNNVPFHRVIDGFMNQTGDGSNGDGTGDSDLPDIPAEFTFRRDASLPVTMVTARREGDKEIGVGFYKSLPVATQPISQAMLTKDGKVGAFGLHCKGVTSMARTSDPNSANSQFFLMRAKAGHLDAQYSIWGQTVLGRDILTKFKVGTKGQQPGFVPDQMNKVYMASDLPKGEAVRVDVMKTTSPAFNNHLKTFKNSDGSYPDICKIDVPSRSL